MTVICSVNDYQIAAKQKLSSSIDGKALYEYLASGSDDEQTLADNRAAFKGWYLRPRVLRPIGTKVSTQTTIRLGKNNSGAPILFKLSLPLFVSPAGVHALVDPQQGECATARACAKHNVPFGLSQHSTRSIEQVRLPNSIQWYQLYILKNRSITASLIQRAKVSGYQALIWTVDSVRFGFREADQRNGFDSLPPPHRLVNYDGNQTIVPGSSSLSHTYNGKKHKSWDQNSELLFDPDTTWADLAWLKSFGLPVIVKGIMCRQDATLAVQAGADGIVVSNHGGRQLDGCLATIDVLPEVIDAVQGTIPVFLDGGVRRGTDILKALALGATAVGIGKPLFFALAVDGELGVHNVLKMLQTELESVMALTGCPTIADIQPDLVCRHPYPHSSTYVRSKL